MDTSKIFCLHCTSLRQGITGTGAVLFPADTQTIPVQNPNKSGTISVRSYLSAHPKTGRARRSLSKVCPQGTHRNFVEGSRFPHNQNCCAPLTDKAALPPYQSRKVRKCPEKVTKCAVCFGFGDLSCGFVGVYSRQLLLKNAWECGRIKAQTSRGSASHHGGMYSDCGKKPAGVVGHRPKPKN